MWGPIWDLRIIGPYLLKPKACTTPHQDFGVRNGKRSRIVRRRVISRLIFVGITGRTVTDPENNAKDMSADESSKSGDV